MKLIFAGVALTALATVAITGAPAAVAGPEQDFLSVVSEGGIDWPAGKTQQVIDTGHAVCTDWDNGATLAQEVKDLQGATDWTDYQVGVFIGAATAAFCPQYQSKIS